MIEKKLIEKHDEILNYLQTYKQQNENFTFSPRQNHNDLDNNHLSCRLCKGFWFQGTEKYIFIALYKRGCNHNKTKTIGFVFQEGIQYVEIVFKKVDEITEDELTFYNDLIAYLKGMQNIFKEIEEKENQYFFIFATNELEKNLNYFIKEFKNKADELIKKYHLENKYFISKKELQSRLNEIERIKNTKISTTHNNIEVVNVLKNKNYIKNKNIILYGAPGVGKTHNYKKLLALIEGGDFSEKDIFDFVINNKDDAIEEGSIERLYQQTKDEKRVEFVTFHQSYSYEDFIEGYRPDEDSNNIIRKDGIFKLIADEARRNLEDSQKQIDVIEEERKFEELFELFKDYIEDEIDKNKKFAINETAYITNIEHDAFRYQGDNWGYTQRMKFLDIELLYRSGIYERKDIKKVKNVSGLAKQHATYFSYFMKQFLEFKNKQKIEIQNIDKIEQKNFYIVIDEINRGNISKIFGELITLIEEDKRDKYEITLPYSKKPFKVPSNLYIIATMNSTDKSIATIDIALRRRFTFLKMKPKLELVKNTEAKEFMDVLNQYILKKLGEDYMLGHSYFMGDIDLEFVKEYKIKPLLEEYFYADEKSSDEIIVAAFNEVKKDIKVEENNE